MFDLAFRRGVRGESRWWLDAVPHASTIVRMDANEMAVRVTAGGGKVLMSRRLTSFLALLVWVIGFPVLAAESEKKPMEETKQAEVLAEYNIEKGGRAVLLPIRIQDQEYLFLLDTGATCCAFDVSLRKFLGKQIGAEQVMTAAESVKAEFFRPPEAFLGKLDLREGGPVFCTDLETARRVIGRELRGVLGMGFLKKYVVRIDFDSGKLQFRTWDGRGHPEWGSAVYLYEAGGRVWGAPYVKGNLTGLGDIKFLLDSGCNGAGGLVTDLFERAMDKTALAEGRSATLAGTRRFRKTRIGELALGGFAHSGLVMEDGTHNMIGLGFLSRYVVTLDFPSMQMYLQKGQAFDKPDEIDMSGVHLIHLEGRTFVEAVDKSSPAETAGIKPEDVVLKVGETNATQMDIYDLRDLLKSGDGREINMTIKRGEEEKAVTFKLKRQI
jgi:hypothetical protein